MRGLSPSRLEVQGTRTGLFSDHDNGGSWARCAEGKPEPLRGVPAVEVGVFPRLWSAAYHAYGIGGADGLRSKT